MALGLDPTVTASSLIADGGIVFVVIADLAHPDLPTLRVCDDNAPLDYGGHTYAPLAMTLVPPADADKEKPSARLEIDNTDHADSASTASAWLRAAGERGGATARLRALLRRQRAGAADLELSRLMAAYDFNLAVGRLDIAPYAARVHLEFPALLSRPAVLMRYDSRSFPLMFPRARTQT